jgi:hypothetical protein
VNRRLYDAIADMIGPALVERMYLRLPPDAELPKVAAAVYVALNGDGQPAYVGSVHRPSCAHALADRMREHRASERWHWLVVFPIHASTPTKIVRLLEGAVSSVLWPSQTRRRPRSDLPPPGGWTRAA